MLSMKGLQVKRIGKLVVGRWRYCGIAYAIKYETWLFDCMNFGCLIRACPYLDNVAKNRQNRLRNKANCADNIEILTNNSTQFR